MVSILYVEYIQLVEQSQLLGLQVGDQLTHHSYSRNAVLMEEYIIDFWTEAQINYRIKKKNSQIAIRKTEYLI